VSRPAPGGAPAAGGATALRAPKAPASAPSGFWALLLTVGVLNVVGLVMVLSASSVEATRDYGSTWAVFLRQAMWLALGVVALAVFARIDYRRWRRLAAPALALAVLLLVLVLVPGLGVTVNGATSWLGTGPLRFQPSEFAKLAVLLWAADLLARRARHAGNLRLTLVPVLVVFGGVALLLMLEPDLGTTLAMAAIVGAVLFVAGVPLLPLGAALGAGGLVATLLAMAAPYRRARLLAFLHPEADPLNSGWQSFQSLVGVSSGGLFGVGLGASRAKWGFLPNAHSDFIFAIIAEELGLVGALLVLGLLVAFGVFGVRAALRAPDRFGLLVGAGVTAWVLAQALVNIGAVVGMLPITGITLPFVSAGGSSLVVLMAATGILLNVARQGRVDAAAAAPAARDRQPRAS
jgi:cell division protein FtsW